MDTLGSLRKSVALTQKQLASMLNVTQSAVSQWERGDSRPDIEAVPLLAKAFGVTEGDIIAAITNAKQDTA